MKRFVAGLLLLGTILAASGAVAAPDRKAPKIVGAVMQDADGDYRGDRVVLTYSEAVRHARDTDGRYPFRVAGYTIASVGAASGKKLTLLLVEKAAPDGAARPAVTYSRTTSKPVTDRARNQAARQTFGAVRAHGGFPPVGPPSPPPGPPPAPPPPPDTTPPDTTLTSGPSGTVTTRSATFTYSSSDATATFECALDTSGFAACPVGGQIYSNVSDGSHTFQVRSRDPSRERRRVARVPHLERRR